MIYSERERETGRARKLGGGGGGGGFGGGTSKLDK